MNMIGVKDVARERGVKPGKMKKAELVRAIQSAEANAPCFNTRFSAACGQDGCLWREDCD